MTVAKDALPWLKPYLVNAPPLANLTRTATLNYSPTVALTIKEGAFSIPFGGTKNPPRIRNDRKFDNVNSVDIFSLTITRPLGFYGQLVGTGKAMATGLYVYKTDRGKFYAVRIDKKLGNNPAFGFRELGKTEEMDGLPRNTEMRSIGCVAPIGSNYRRFPVGKPAAEILKTFARFTYKGVQYTPRWYKPEKSRK